MGWASRWQDFKGSGMLETIGAGVTGVMEPLGFGIAKRWEMMFSLVKDVRDVFGFGRIYLIPSLY